MSIRWTLALLLAAIATAVAAKDTHAIADSELARLELYARMQTLNATILGGASATTVLQNWCRDHQLADPPVVVAVKLKSERSPPPAQVVALLKVSSGDELAYRRVELRCGDVVMSKAENWFVPARLTVAMNAQLDGTQTPFGAVVAPLGPVRRTLASTLTWHPLTPGFGCCACGANAHAVSGRDSADEDLRAGAGCMTASAPLPIPPEIFRHQALVYTRDMLPIALVSEVYQGALLAYPLQHVRD